MEMFLCRDLCDDFMLEILSRLPVKSLMRFKCVSKSWNSLQSNPNFIAHHLNQRQITSSNKPSLLVNRKYERFNEPFVSYLSSETMEIVHDFFLPFLTTYDHPTIYGPLNGILCLQTDQSFGSYPSDGHSERDVALWNPATREFNLLPATHIAKPPRFSRSTRRVGFGFDPESNDYKVVRINIFYINDLVTEPRTYTVEVYSLNCNCWKQIDTTIPLHQADFIRTCWRFPSFSNGIQYWLAADQIASFDFADEEFGLIPFPANVIGNKRVKDSSIGVINDSLSLVLSYQPLCGEYEFEIWAMKEERNWIQQIKLRVSGQFRSFVGFWNDDQFLLIHRNGYLVLYDSNGQEFRHLELYCFNHKEHFRAVMYKESLVSVKGQIEPLVPAFT